MQPRKPSPMRSARWMDSVRVVRFGRGCYVSWSMKRATCCQPEGGADRRPSGLPVALRVGRLEIITHKVVDLPFTWVGAAKRDDVLPEGLVVGRVLASL